LFLKKESKMNTEMLLEKWGPVIDHAELNPVKDTHKRAVLAQLLENQEADSRAQAIGSGGYSAPTLLGEAAPANAMGGSSSVATTGNVDIFDPVLISLVRRSMPNLIAYDICGVQPMTGPTGLIFALRSRYTSQTGSEALFNEANTTFSASAGGNTASQFVVANSSNRSQGSSENDPTARAAAGASGYTVSTGMTTARAEALGDNASGNAFQQMAFSVEKVAVTAVSRALKAEYTMELAQDLKAIHGLDAETELANILSAEILAEINREVVRTINYSANAGAQEGVTSTGTFNLDVDSNGRWMVEKFKGLIFQIEREANQIAKATRRGKGNILICSSDVASALQMAGVLDYTPALSANLSVDDTGNTFAGVLNGRIRVYIDPYFSSSSGKQYMTVGYKGSSAFDAGLFYCPYVPLQMVRAVGQDTFQPKIGFKTRYGMVANPFATSDATGAIGAYSDARANKYYRFVAIQNLM
jgi:Major capsid protein Gp23